MKIYYTEYFNPIKILSLGIHKFKIILHVKIKNKLVSVSSFLSFGHLPFIEKKIDFPSLANANLSG